MKIKIENIELLRERLNSHAMTALGEDDLTRYTEDRRAGFHSDAEIRAGRRPGFI